MTNPSKLAEEKLIRNENLTTYECDLVVATLKAELIEHAHVNDAHVHELCPHCQAGLRIWIAVQNNDQNMLAIHKRAEKEILAFILEMS